MVNENREEEIDRLVGQDMIYDCKHLEIQLPDGVARFRVRMALGEPYIGKHSIPHATYHCAKLGIACPYMNESSVMAEGGKLSSFPIVHLVNLERALDCPDREDSEDARPNHTIPRINFLMTRLQKALEER
jgi:hypothetical protein